jgi:hypothetical protein
MKGLICQKLELCLAWKQNFLYFFPAKKYLFLFLVSRAHEPQQSLHAGNAGTCR